MLVSGLENASFFKMTSGDNVNYSRLYSSLCECAQAMLDKYEQKQVRSKKLEVKTQAVKALLSALSYMPKNRHATRMAILTALQCHAKALEGYEHLLSTKGNNYALMKQTQALMKHYYYAPASLLQYHELKNKVVKFLNPLLDAEQKEIVSALYDEKGLTMKALKTLNMFPWMTADFLLELNKAGLFKASLCIRIFAHRKPYTVASALLKLNEIGLFRPDLCILVLEHEKPFAAVLALNMLKEAELLKPNLWVIVALKHKHKDPVFADPVSAAGALCRLNEAGLLKPNWCALVFRHESPLLSSSALEILSEIGLLKPVLCAEVLKRENPLVAAMALYRLNKAGLLNSYFCPGVLKHAACDEAAEALVELNKYKLDTKDNFSTVLKQENPFNAALTIIKQHSSSLLTGKKQDQVPRQKKPIVDARALVRKTLSSTVWS